MCLLACLYLAAGAAISAHPPSLPAGDFYAHDITYPVNPYGVFELGWQDSISRHFDLTVALRHMSSLGLDWEMRSFNYQYGTNTAEVRVQWFPFRGD